MKADRAETLRWVAAFAKLTRRFPVGSPDTGSDFAKEFIEYLAEDLSIGNFEDSVKKLSKNHSSNYFPTHRQIVEAAPKSFYGSKNAGLLAEPRLSECQMDQLRDSLRQCEIIITVKEKT